MKGDDGSLSELVQKAQQKLLIYRRIFSDIVLSICFFYSEFLRHFKIVLNLQKISKNSIKNSYVLLTQIRQLLTDCCHYLLY